MPSFAFVFLWSWNHHSFSEVLQANILQIAIVCRSGAFPEDLLNTESSSLIIWERYVVLTALRWSFHHKRPLFMPSGPC